MLRNIPNFLLKGRRLNEKKIDGKKPFGVFIYLEKSFYTMVAIVKKLTADTKNNVELR